MWGLFPQGSVLGFFWVRGASHYILPCHARVFLNYFGATASNRGPHDSYYYYRIAWLFVYNNTYCIGCARHNFVTPSVTTILLFYNILIYYTLRLFIMLQSGRIFIFRHYKKKTTIWYRTETIFIVNAIIMAVAIKIVSSFAYKQT